MPVAHIGHQRGDRVLLLEATPASASAQHIFWISRNQTPTPGRPNSMVKPTSPTFTRPLTSLVFTSSVPRPCDAGGFVRHARIGEGAAHHARPRQLLRLESGRRADVRLRIEAQPHHLEHLAHGAHHRRIQVLLAQAVEAGVALHAFVAVDGGALDDRVDIDRAHRADVRAIAAGNAFGWIDLHQSPQI